MPTSEVSKKNRMDQCRFTYSGHDQETRDLLLKLEKQNRNVARTLI